MRRSFLSRNVFLISGVVAAHLLFLLSFLPGSYALEKTNSPESILVSLVSERVNNSVPKKSQAIPRFNMFASKGDQVSTQSEEAPSHASAEGVGHFARSTARQAIHSPKPHYPLASKRLREQGLVMIKLCVNEQGIVDEVGISKSSGFKNLDHSALNALAKWKFSPISSNSSSLASQCFQTSVQFTLEG